MTKRESKSAKHNKTLRANTHSHNSDLSESRTRNQLRSNELIKAFTKLRDQHIHLADKLGHKN